MTKNRDVATLNAQWKLGRALEDAVDKHEIAHLDPQLYFSEDGTPARTLRISCAKNVVFEAWIETPARKWAGGFRIYRPYGRFGQGLSGAKEDQFKERGWIGEFGPSVSREKVIDQIVASYKKIYDQSYRIEAAADAT